VDECKPLYHGGVALPAADVAVLVTTPKAFHVAQSAGALPAWEGFTLAGRDTSLESLWDLCNSRAIVRLVRICGFVFMYGCDSQNAVETHPL
jgi:hypothetical protein